MEAETAPADLLIIDFDWPDWMLNAPTPGDIVEGYPEPPRQRINPNERAAEILSFAKEDADAWAMIKPYLKKEKSS